MYCPHCGAKNENDAQFCAACGRSMQSGESGSAPEDTDLLYMNGEDPVSLGKQRRVKRVVIALAAVLVALSMLGGFTVRYFWTANQWQEYYDLGEGYLADGNYEEAIVAFTKAIEIDEKREAAYVGRGDAYLGSAQKAMEEGRFEEAAELYQKAEVDYKEAAVLGAAGSKDSAKEAEIRVSELRYESEYMEILEMYRTAEEENYEREDDDMQVSGSGTDTAGNGGSGSAGSGASRTSDSDEQDEDDEKSVNPVLYELEDKNTKLHYTLQDLNEDGIPELFIADDSEGKDRTGGEKTAAESTASDGSLSDDIDDETDSSAADERDSEKNGTASMEEDTVAESFLTDYDVYDIYTMRDGKAVRLYDTDPTDGNFYTIREDGLVARYHVGSGGREEIDILEMEEDSYELTRLNRYYAERIEEEAGSSASSSASYSFNSRGTDGEERELTGQEWNDLGDTYPAETVEWYRISDLEPLGGEKEEEDESWKEAYISYIETTHSEWLQESGQWSVPVEETYNLADVDGDEIPELYIDFQIGASGSVLCTYAGGRVEELDIPYSFSYIEGESLLRSYGGRMDYYYDRIYRMEDGEFILIGSGEYGNLGGGSITYGSDGEPVYDYEWEGTEVSSEEEYLEQLNEVYDTQQETTPLDGTSYDSARGRYVGGNICYYDEIIEAIRQY